MSVVKFLVKYFSKRPFLGGLWLCTFDCLYPKVLTHPFFSGMGVISSHHPSINSFSSSSHPARLSWFMLATAIALYLDDTTRLLIKALLKKGFKPTVIVSVIPCKVRAVYRIRRSFEMPTPKKKSVGRYSRITLPMR